MKINVQYWVFVKQTFGICLHRHNVVCDSCGVDMSPPLCNVILRLGAKYCDQHVCLSICLLAYLKNPCPNFTKFCVCVTCGRGSILL